MLSRDRIWYTFLLFLYIVGYMSRALASKPSYASNMQICSAFSDQMLETAVLPVQNFQAFSQEDSFTPAQLLPIMAGSEEDCKLGAQVVYSAVTKNDLMFRIFKLLRNHPLFRISFDFPDRGKVAGKAVGISDRFIIYIKPSDKISELTVRHELMHLFLTFIHSTEFDPETFPFIINTPDLVRIFEHAGQKIDANALQTAWGNKARLLAGAYKKDLYQIVLTEEEQSLLNHVKAAIENDARHENEIYINVKSEEAAGFKAGRQYPVQKIRFFKELAKSSEYFHLYNIEDLGDNDIGLYIGLDNPLLLFLIHQMKNINMLKKYDPEDQFEESITYAVESPSLEALQILYPELIEMLTFYTEKFEANYTPSGQVFPPLLSHYAHRNLFTVTNLPLKTEKDRTSAYGTLASIVLKQRKASDRDLDIGLSVVNQLIKHEGKELDNPTKALHRIILGELLYLRGNTKLAAVQYYKAEKLDKNAFDEFKDALRHKIEATEVRSAVNKPSKKLKL